MADLEYGLLKINNIKKSWIIRKEGSNLDLTCQSLIKRKEKEILRIMIRSKLERKGVKNIVIWFD